MHAMPMCRTRPALVRIVCIFCSTETFFCFCSSSSSFSVPIRIRLRFHSFRDYCCWIPFVFLCVFIPRIKFHSSHSLNISRWWLMVACGTSTILFSFFFLFFAVQLLANHFATHLLIYSQTMGASGRLAVCWWRTLPKLSSKRSAQRKKATTANNHNCWL